MSELSDDECIAIALLHGCKFDSKEITTTSDGEKIRTNWWSAGEWDGDEPHEIEDNTAYNPDAHDISAFRTREALARAYCKFYGLLEEVT